MYKALSVFLITACESTTISRKPTNRNQMSQPISTAYPQLRAGDLSSRQCPCPHNHEAKDSCRRNIRERDEPFQSGTVKSTRIRKPASLPFQEFLNIQEYAQLFLPRPQFRLRGPYILGWPVCVVTAVLGKCDLEHMWKSFQKEGWATMQARSLIRPSESSLQASHGEPQPRKQCGVLHGPANKTRRES